jgi:DNA ligase-1
MSNFPALQGEDSKGKTRAWSIRVFVRDGCGVIETTYGLLGGKMIVNERDVCVGKNIGKKNETTPLQQAVAEARSAWVKTKESGYSEVLPTRVSPKRASPKRASPKKALPEKASPSKAPMCAAEQKALEAAQAAYADCHRVQRPTSPKVSPRPASPARATSRKIKRPTFPPTAQAQRAQDQRSNSPKATRAQDQRSNSPKAARAASPRKASPVKERGKGIDASVPLPMLAHDYNKRGKGALYPCFVQPKLDGTRCIGIPRKGLFSRMRKSFPHMEHIVAELNQLPADVILDGELYTDELTFQQIVGLVKRETLREGNAENQVKIKYHVYDMVSAGTFEERYAALTKLIRGHRFRHIVLVPTERCASEERMKAKHNEYVAEGFEGIMLRNPAGLYKHSRSTDLLKYKEFIDEEFTVVGFTEGDGQDKGCVVWICETEEKKRFQCRPRGTKEERKEMFQNGDAYIGKKLTVRFQEWSDAHIPRFPVGIAFRDYE